jgi:hypothetical protein
VDFASGIHITGNGQVSSLALRLSMHQIPLETTTADYFAAKHPIVLGVGSGAMASSLYRIVCQLQMPSRLCIEGPQCAILYQLSSEHTAFFIAI